MLATVLLLNMPSLFYKVYVIFKLSTNLSKLLLNIMHTIYIFTFVLPLVKIIYIVLPTEYLYHTIMYSSLDDYSVLMGDYKINFCSTWY